MHIELSHYLCILSPAEVAKSIKVDEGAIAQKPLLQEGMFLLIVHIEYCEALPAVMVQ